ncbi:MAG: histidine phosphatase family protein [Deltaproteobacteria bacterium]|nr:histidine phosphatase family protein [Deltaproteobacteria bacterium]
MDAEKKLRVVLMRHGETEGNVQGIVQGHWDTPLTERGISSTLKKAQKFKTLSFDAVFCSDLSRTVETLKLIQRVMPQLPTPVYTKRLREIDFGDFTGQPKKELMPTILKHKAAPDLPYPNGESGGAFTNRVKTFFSMLREEFGGKQVLAVTHYGVMETVARQFTEPPSYEKIYIGADDVWRVCFTVNGLAKREIL